MLSHINALAATVEVKYRRNNQEVVIVGQKSDLGYRFNPIATQVVTLATLDWPPYIGEGLCDKGWVFRYAVALLVSKGYQVQVEFYPWARAVKLVESGQIDILFPEYFIEKTAPSDVYPGTKRREYLVLSEVFPGGSIGFIKRKGYQDKFSGNLNNLIGETIGVVRGYQNTPQFDQMMDNGKFNIVSAVNDLQLMRMLVAKRVNLIIGDPKVLRYSVEHSALAPAEKALIQAGTEEVVPSLQYNFLYFAISKKRPGWQDLLDDINVAISEFERQGITDNIITEASQCVP